MPVIVKGGNHLPSNSENPFASMTFILGFPEARFRSSTVLYPQSTRNSSQLSSFESFATCKGKE